MSLDDVGLNELNLRAVLLEQIIAEYEGDPRLPEPIRQLEIIREEIRKRLNMANFQSMKTPDLEQRRAVLQEQIEKASAEFMEIGRIIDIRLRAEALAKKAEAIDAQQEDLLNEIKALNQEGPPPVVVKMNPIVARIFAKKAG